MGEKGEMIGTTGRGEDIYVFFEGADLEKLNQNKVTGVYIRSDLHRTIDVTCSLSDEQCKTRGENVVALFLKTNEVISSLDLVLREAVYQRLVKSGYYIDHHGWRHVNLLAVDSLKRGDREMYDALIRK